MLLIIGDMEELSTRAMTEKQFKGDLQGQKLI